MLKFGSPKRGYTKGASSSHGPVGNQRWCSRLLTCTSSTRWITDVSGSTNRFREYKMGYQSVRQYKQV
jgi:hypothetical protein